MCQIQYFKELYIGLLNNIKKLVKHNQQYKDMNWTQRPQTNFENTILRTIDEDSKVDIRKAKCKVYYNILIRSKYLEPSSLRHWNDDHLLNDNKIFYDSFKYAKSSTHETRLLVFQFKLTHRIINTNSNLNKWKIIRIQTVHFTVKIKSMILNMLLLNVPGRKTK